MGSSVSRKDIEQHPSFLATKSEKNNQSNVVFDVYSQPINPDNQMPINPNQYPSDIQQAPLPTERVKSTIPKGGTEGDTWTYPSPQMFFNALHRKGKGAGVREEDMTTVVAIHNNMNERTWKQLLQWEDQCPDCPTPKLLKFRGRPNELTPRAWFNTHVLGNERPFDRHDWIVDRCGKQVRYVIDYYHDERKSSLDELPGLFDNNSVRSIHVDVRPALDSFDAFVLRMKNLFSSTGRTIAEEQNDVEIYLGKELMRKGSQVSQEDIQHFLGKKCAEPIQAFANCVGTEKKDKDCSKELLGANFCLGSVVCPDVSQKFLSTLKTDVDKADEVLEEMYQCIQKSPLAKSLLSQSDN